MKSIISKVVFIFLFISSITEMKAQDTTSINLMQNCKLVYKKGQIPCNIKSAYRRTYKARFSMANPNRDYRNTCTSNRWLKDRRLVFFAQCDSMSILLYDRSYALVSNRKIIQFKTENKKIKIVKNMTTGRQCNSIEDVLILLNKEKYSSVEY